MKVRFIGGHHHNSSHEVSTVYSQTHRGHIPKDQLVFLTFLLQDGTGYGNDAYALRWMRNGNDPVELWTPVYVWTELAEDELTGLYHSRNLPYNIDG